MEQGTSANYQPGNNVVGAEEQGEAASPYPNILQHRELHPRYKRRAIQSVKSSDIAHLVLPDPDTPMNIVGLPPVTSAGTESSASKQNTSTGLNSDALNAEEREKLVKIVVERAEMAEFSEKRKRQASEVIEASGVPIAHPYGSSYIDIFHAACDGDPKVIRWNLDHGADINALGQPNPTQYDGVQFEKRWTFYGPPIVFAAAFGRERAVRALIAWGANVHQKSSTGLEAKDYAMKRGYKAIVEMIEEAERRAAAAAPKLVLVRKDRGETIPEITS